MKSMLFLLLVAVAGCFHTGAAEFAQCEQTYSKEGCFNVTYTKESFKTLLLAYRGELKWDRYPESLHSLACKCVKIARERKFTFFSIRFYGECWGAESFGDFMSYPEAMATSCIGGDYKQCIDTSPKECSGDQLTDYIYKLDDINVDGGYSEWNSWSRCSASCGEGFKSRERTCTNPPPQGNGKHCHYLGPEAQTNTCKEKECPIDGGYTEWKSASNCSKTCGSGFMTYTRTCTNPKPAHGGKNCSGDAITSKLCNTNECPSPVDGGYTKWKLASKCSKTCGRGYETYTRTCTNPKPAHGGKRCSGPSRKTQLCNIKPCPVNGRFTKWKPASKCSKSCGHGKIKYRRTCTNPRPAHGGKKCSGATQIIKPCNTQACPAKRRRHFMVCEHQAGKTLSCPPGKAISLKYVNYGRTSSKHCGYRRNYNMNCRSSSSLKLAKMKCEGRNSCFLLASNGIYGDPCRGTVKYLEVMYICKTSPVTGTYACEHGPPKIIGCQTGKVMQVVAASYGRLSNRICRRRGYWKNIKCAAKASLSKVKALCNGKQRCKIHATSSIFGNPCVGVRKYLTVSYRCIPKPAHTKTVCEHQVLGIRCSLGYKLNIVDASYGRLSMGYCKRYYHHSWTCHARSSLGKVKSRCNGKSSCFIKASNSVFGDPCRGVFKYLQVEYQCVPKS